MISWFATALAQSVRNHEEIGRKVFDDGSPHACEIVTAAPIGPQLRLWRQLRRMKQSHAAELLGVSQGAISRWETGAERVDAEREKALRALMQARLDSAADRELARLVASSASPMHLVCDLTHRLLALSPARAREGQVCSAASQLGQSLWRYATDAIVAAEGALPDLGWFEGNAGCLEFETGRNRSSEWVIRKGRYRIVRLRLSDGSHARLVETIAD